VKVTHQPLNPYTREYLGWLALLDVILLGVTAAFYRPLLALTFDEEFARLRGLPVTSLYLLLMLLIALTVVLLLQVVGLILVIALLTLPAALASHWARSLIGIMVMASGLGMLYTLSGLALAYAPDWPVGPVIILLATSAYLLSIGIRRLQR